MGELLAMQNGKSGCDADWIESKPRYPFGGVTI